jgi:Tfp pilus assembly protein PilF
MKRSVFVVLIPIFLLIMIFPSACSTKPKNPGDIYDTRKRAEAQLELGNKQADRGDIDTALSFLDEAFQLAIATDDPSLRVRAGLSRSNVLFLLGRGDEAADGWNDALAEAQRIGNAELAAVCRVHLSRGKLLSQGKTAAQSVKDEVNRELSQIKSDNLYIAFAWTVLGLAEKELGRYADAEAALRRALDIHEKDRNLELAAYDWFLIASFRSLSGNYTGARQALESAIAFDRRVENSWGLANDWRALGEVYTKAKDPDAARAAYTRAAGIYRALGNNEMAEEILARIGG